MVRYCFILMSLVFQFSRALSQDTMQVLVRQESTLEIHGKTNINNFTCRQTYPSPGLKEVELYTDGDEVRFQDAELVIPVARFDCGHKIMTKDFQEILDAENNPDLKIILHAVHTTGASKVADVTIRLAGSSQRYRIPFTIKRDSDSITGVGERKVRFGEFDLEPPVKFMGMVKVKEELNIQFTLRIKQIR